MATVAALLDAADALAAEQGANALTTTAVARRAGVAVGTVYQYFSDVDTLADAVIARHADAFAEQLADELAGLGLRRKRDAANAALDAFSTYHREHAGFRELWPSRGVRTHLQLATVVTDALVERGLADPDDEAFRLEAEVQWAVAQALVELAFRRDPDGDPVVLAHLRHLWDLDVPTSGD